MIELNGVIDQAWELIAAIAGALGVIFTLKKYIEQIRDDISKPFNNLDKKIDSKFNEVNTRIDNKMNEVGEKIDSLGSELESLKSTTSDQNDSIVSLLRDRLFVNYGKAKEEGYASSRKKELFHSMYNEYKKLGGDGFIEEIVYPEFMSLPDTPPKDKK